MQINITYSVHDARDLFWLMIAMHAVNDPSILYGADPRFVTSVKATIHALLSQVYREAAREIDKSRSTTRE